MPFCPTCRQEFESFARACPDCEVALVDSLPDPTATPAPPPTCIVGVDEDAAGELLGLLRSVGIPAAPVDAPETGRPAVLVPADAAATALQVLEAHEGLVREPGDPPTFRRVESGGAEVADDEPLDPSLVSGSVREIAARGPEAIGALLDYIRRGEGEARRKAVLAVQAMGPVGQAALVRHAALLSRERREQAVFAVIREVRERDVPAEPLAELIGVATDAAASPDVRVLALHALGRLPARKAVAPAAVALLDDDHLEIREAADEALCNLFDDDVGFEGDAAPEERAAAVSRWRERLGG